MKAIVISKPGGPEVLQLQQCPDPQPGNGELGATVSATALNRADLLQRRGLYPPPDDAPQEIPGLEFAGRVETPARSASGFKAGDRIMGLLGGGGYAERVVLHESLALPVPKAWSDEEAAAFPEAFLTAYDALFPQLGLHPGETLLIHAVGSGVGLAALQLAKAAGANVAGTAGSQEKLDRAAEFGLDFGVCYRETCFEESIRDFTAGRGCQAIIDFVGAPYWERNLKCLAPMGRLIVVGLLGGAKAETDLALVLRKRLRVMGTVLRSRSLWEKAKLVDRVERHVLPLAERGKIRPVVDRILPLREAAEAHAYMESNRNVGKIVLQVSG